MKILPLKNIRGWVEESDIPIETTPVWNSNISYKLYDTVAYGSFVYRSLSDNNTYRPTIETKWKRLRPVNQIAYLDANTSNRSYSRDTINLKVKIDPDADMIVAGGLCGDEATFKLFDSSDNEIYSETIPLGSNYTIDEMSWWHWTYPTAREGYELTNRSWIHEVSPGSADYMTVEITPILSQACIGLLGFGTRVWVGCTLEKISRRIKGSIKANITEYNQSLLGKREGYIKLILNIKMIDEAKRKKDLEYIDSIQKILERYINLPIGFFADDTGESYSLMAYGVYDTIESAISPAGTYDITISSIENIFA
jgi:hypothetical protein